MSESLGIGSMKKAGTTSDACDCEARVGSGDSYGTAPHTKQAIMQSPVFHLRAMPLNEPITRAYLQILDA